MTTRLLKISVVVTGISGIVAQIVLLRELLVSFLGNELTIGIILANWLLLEAIGSFLIGRTAEKNEKRLDIYLMLLLLFALALPFCLYLSRILKSLLLVTPGEGFSLIPLLYASFFILLPVAVIHGALFTYGCKILAGREQKDAVAAGKVYIWENLGTLMGGAAVTFLLIPFLNSFSIAFLISFLHCLVSFFLLQGGMGKPGAGKSLRSWASAWGAFLFLILSFPTLSVFIEQSSHRLQWPGLEVLHYENSRYGNITVTRKADELTFFTDGTPAVTTPNPNTAALESLVHFPMLLHEDPQTVLVLSGGAGGMINELLKYPLRRLDYVELDPLLLQLIQKYPTPLTEAELADPRVKIHFTDGRFFVNHTEERFDLIFIGVSAPRELQTNRLFSAEFFSRAHNRLNPGGMLVLSLPGSLTAMSNQLRDLNRCILDTLQKNFPHVRVIPGETNLYLASQTKNGAGLTARDLAARLQERNVPTLLISQEYLEYRLHERWLARYWQLMGPAQNRINSDFRPLGAFLNLAYWNAMFSPGLAIIFAYLEKIDFKAAAGTIIFITLLLGLVLAIKPGISSQSVTWAIFGAGFAGMIFELAIIFAFQAVFGHLYHQIGLLITVFMAGTASGSFIITRRMEKLTHPYGLFLLIQLALILIALTLPFLLTAPVRHLAGPEGQPFLKGLFLLMSLACGFFLGLLYPLAVKLYLQEKAGPGRIAHTAGLLYGSDLMGGFFGGILGGVIMLPLLGLKESCLLMAVLLGGSLALLGICRKKGAFG
jgi:spermidine synthase